MRTAIAMKRDRRVSQIYPLYLTGSFPISMLRNRAVSNALAVGCDYLLMIDNDMVPDLPIEDHSGNEVSFWKTAWEFMINRREREVDEVLSPAVIAAPYLCNEDGDFYSTDWKYPDNPWKSDYEDLVPISRDDAFSRRGIQTVATTQTGLILYDLRVFDIIPPPWFTFEWQDSHQFFMLASEDHFQTRRCSVFGCPVYMAWDCWAGHLKTQFVLRDPPEGQSGT